MNPPVAFVEVHQRLFATANEERARTHIDAIVDPEVRAMAEAMWLLEKIKRRRESKDGRQGATVQELHPRDRRHKAARSVEAAEPGQDEAEAS